MKWLTPVIREATVTLSSSKQKRRLLAGEAAAIWFTSRIPESCKSMNEFTRRNPSVNGVLGEELLITFGDLTSINVYLRAM